LKEKGGTSRALGVGGYCLQRGIRVKNRELGDGGEIKKDRKGRKIEGMRPAWVGF